MGMPVSRFSWARMPFPVMASPSSDAAKPSMATRPTNSSFSLVKPIPPDVPKIPSSTFGLGLGAAAFFAGAVLTLDLPNRASVFTETDLECL